MAIETDADRDVFVEPDDFGVAATWNAGAGPVSVNGIFEDSYFGIDAGNLEFTQSGARIQFLVKSSSIPAGAAQGNPVVVDSVQYKVLEIQPDGTGMTVVRLEEV